MRTTAITVHNNEKLEIFVERRKRHFELWMAGPIKGRRMLLDHHLTHDDLEANLEYANPGDLAWRDAAHSELPIEKHQNAIEMEKTIEQGVFWDYDDPRLDGTEAVGRQALSLPPWSGSHRSVGSHLGSIAFLVTDKKEMSAAQRFILGRWTDGVATLNMEPEHKLGWLCTDQHHPLNVGEQVHNYAPDWWNFAMWRLALMNDERKCGTHIGVLRVDEQELHLSSGRPHRIAHVFQRIGCTEANAVQKSEAVPAKPKKAKRVAGVATPLLRRLEQAIIGRNPLLAERLKAGLLESDIRAALSQAKVAGEIEPIIQLYSWRNGMALDDETPMGEASFFPEDIYQFMDLETALDAWRTMNQAPATLRGMFQEPEAHSLFSGFMGQLFPLFRDGASGSIAVDLTPSKGSRVVAVEFESTEPVRQAYGSFDEFIKDAIRVNKEGDSLSCFQSHESED